MSKIKPKLAKEYVGRTLDASDFSKHEKVLVVTNDSSVFLFNFAFFEEKEKRVCVFSEHQGYHEWYKEDVEAILQL